MKALVTGADGFIGSHLVELLLKEGWEVRALAQYNSFNSWGWLDSIPLPNGLEVISGDIRDSQCCKSLMEGIDAVYHLAALIAIPYSYRAPASYIETNVNGTLNICQAALEEEVQRLVHISTSEVYGTARYVPIDENHPLQAQSPYSASKIAADAVATSFYHSFNLPVTIARPFNTYGPRQSARAVIPNIISQIANGAKHVSLGDTRPTRDFNYVSDTCRGILALTRCRDAVGEVVNIGSNSEISIVDTLDLIKCLMDSDAELMVDPSRVRPANSEVERLCCDNRKLQSLTGFEGEIDIHEGLRRTIAWFRDPENLSRYKTQLYNV